MLEQVKAQEAQWLRWRSLADLYHAFFTGLVLTVVTRRGTPEAAEFIFRVFRRQQLERFLPYRLSILSNTISQAIADDYQRRYDISVTEWRVMAVLARRLATMNGGAVSHQG